MAPEVDPAELEPLLDEDPPLGEESDEAEALEPPAPPELAAGTVDDEPDRESVR